MMRQKTTNSIARVGFTRSAVLATAAVALVLAVAVPVPAQQTKAQELAQKGWSLLQEGKFEEGLEVLQEAIEEDPNRPQSYFFLGYAYGNLGRDANARDAFMKAAELAPQWGDALNMTAVAAFQAGDVELAWDYAIRAKQAGANTDAIFGRLESTAKPDDLEARLNAARVFVDELDVTGLRARNENPFGRAVDTGDGATGDVTQQGVGNPQSRSTTTSQATSVGNRILAESQADLNQLLRQTRLSLADSRAFGLVPTREMATYVLSIEIDDLGEDPSRRPLEGYIKLIDARTGEEAYRRILELRNVASVADLNADIERYVDYLEEWIAEQNR